MIGETAILLRLRWLVVVFFGLLWTTIGGAASLAERDHFGPSSPAAKTTAQAPTSNALAKYWPDNSGFIGQVERTHLMPGAQIDRYGFPGGKFVSPAGTSFEARALPAEYFTSKPYHAYEVLKPIEVNSGRIMPWFNQPGMGMQHELPVSVDVLLKRGFLKEVGP